MAIQREKINHDFASEGRKARALLQRDQQNALARYQQQSNNLLQQIGGGESAYWDAQRRKQLQSDYDRYMVTLGQLGLYGMDTDGDMRTMRSAVDSVLDFQNQFKDENDFNVSYAYPTKYKGKNRTDVNAALAQLKNTPGAEAEYDWLNKNQMNYWSADELKAQIGTWQNEISGIEQQRRNMPRMAAGSTDADYAKRQQEALALSSQIDERKAKIGQAQNLITQKTYDAEIGKWDTQMQKALSDYSKALSVSESANTEMAMAGNSAFVVQNSEYATNARNTVRSFEQQLRDYGYSDQQINGIRNYALTQQHANEAAEIAQQVAQEAKEHPWLSSAMSVGTNIMAGAGALDIAAQNALNGADPFTGEKMAVDRYTKSMVPSTVTNTIRGSVSEDMSGIGSFLYNTGMSMADSLATLAIGGVTGLHGAADVILGGAAASQAITDAYDRGASDGQAMSVGLLYGTAEALFEHVSLDKLRMFHTSAAAGKKTVKTLVKNMLKQSFVEGSEEVCTDIANVISDAIVMADKSEINQTIAAYQADGMSEDEATRRAWLDWLGQTAQDFAGGAISGGVMTGGDMALNAGMRSANYRETGRQITANDYADILRRAAEESGDENLQKLAGKKQTNRNTGKLYEATQEANLTQAVSDRLGALGAPENDVQELTGLVVKQIKGQELTGKEQRKFDASKQAQRAANEYASLFTREADQTTNAWARSHMRDAAELERNAIYGAARKAGDGQTQTHQAEKNAEVQVNDATAQVQALRYDQESGSVELSVKAENGDVQRVSVKDAKLPEGTRLLAESAEKYGETAPQMYANYQNGQDVERYANAYEVAYSYGRAGVKNYAVLENSGAASYLTPEQRKFAYETGLAAARRESAAKNAAAKSGEIKAGNVTLEGGKIGNVTLAAVNTAGLTRKQTASIDVARKAAEAIGVNVVFFESQTDEGGKYLGMNGAYRDGTIYLDVNAGKNNVDIGETAILKTMSHELTHFIQQNSGQYETLKEFVANHVLESGDSIERLAQQKIDNDSTGELTMDGAMDEVVADACEMMLRNTDAVQRLANENRSLAEKIRDWIGDFVKKLRAAFKGDHATHDEARAMLDRMQELQKIWDDALVDAAKTKAAKENTAWDGGVQHSERKSLSELGSDALQEYEMYANRYWTEMGVKSPFFRAWFGDWRASDSTDVRIASRIGSERGVQHNDDTGWSINISARVFNETKAHTATYNRGAIDYLPYINDIVKNAILLDSKTMDKKKSNNSLLMHSLYAVANIGDGPVVLKLYVEEMVDPNRSETSKRAYQLQNVEKYQQPDAKGSGKFLSPVIQTADIRTVADLFSYVKQKDKQFHPKSASKVVNGDGTPMVVYHGTSDTFWTFDENEISDREGSFFFAQNIEDAAAYSGNGRIMAVYVNLQNPVDYNDMPLELYALKDKKAQVEALKKLGYDGWMADMDTGWGEVSAFYPEQIKSAYNNKGTFDSVSPDIRFSERERDDVVSQEITSAKTSIKQVAGLFKDKNAKFGKTNIDVGGGRFNLVTDYLAERGTKNMVFDPYNRGMDENTATLRYLQNGGRTDTATCANVLNVIREPDARANVILEVAKCIREGGTAYFTVYEGDGSGEGRQTSSGWQNNRKTADYVSEIGRYFDDVQRKGKLIIATNPKQNLPKASWEVEPGRGVQFSERDSAGNELSQQQSEFFKNSKVVDDDGNLKVMYRGGNGGFTVFDRKHSKGSNLYGRGFYFTDSVSHAAQYGSARAYYLNITSPVSTTETTITRGQMRKFLEAVAANEDDFSFENYGYGSTPSSVLRSVYTSGRSDFAMLYDVDQTAVGDMVASVELFNKVNGTDYDGLILDTETVAFYPEQIKNVDNRKPTSNPDIRFSERDDTRTDRDVLSDAADGDAANVREMEMLQEYREKLREYTNASKQLEKQRQIAQTATDKNERMKAANRANNAALRVSKLDEQLTRMQNAKPLRELVARELKTRDSLVKENAMLRDRVEYWRGQTHRTEEATTDPKAVRKAAKDIIKQTGSSIDVDEVTGRLQELYDGIARATSENGLTQEEIWRRSAELAHDILDDVSIKDDMMYQEYSDLRAYFRNTQITLSPAMLGDFTGFGDFRRRNMGRMRLKKDEHGNVDQIYEEAATMWPGLFDSDRVSHPGDQLREIDDVLNRIYTIDEYNPIWNMREATQSVANEILEQFFDTPEQKTFADKQAAKAGQQKAHYLNKIQELREANDTRISELRAQNRKRLREAVAREREKRDKQIARLKDRNAADKARREENATVAKYRPRIEQKAKRLSDWLLKNSDKEHIPEPLKLAVGEFLESIDFTSKRALDGGALTKKDIQRSLRYTDRMQKLLDSLRGQNDNGTNDLGIYLDIPDGFLEEMQKHINTASDIVSQNPGENVVNRMNGEQLQQLDRMLTILTRSIQNANKLKANAHFETARQAAQATVLELDRLGQAKGRSKAGDKAAGFFSWENTTPYYAFQRFGEGGKAIFEALSDGWDKMAFNTKTVMDFTEQTYTPKEVKAWAKETHTLKLESGKTVKMTTAQMMAFYCLSKREQAIGHLLGGGMRVEDIQNSGRKENIKQPVPFLLTQEDIAAINGALTKRQREVADKLQKYMNDQGGAWGNRVSMERFGYRAFTEENYFPIETMGSNRDARDPGAKENDMFRLLNMSATKSLVYKANNALVVRDIFDVFSNHMADMAKYDALALPILDAMKWYNYREKQKLENGHVLTTTVQRSIEKAYGMDANKYFTTFIKDLNGVNEGGRGEGFAKKMLSNYKVAAVAANLRVALLQPTAYVRAVGVMNPKYLAKAFTEGKSAYKEAEANSGIALWKQMGFYDTNIGMNIRDQIKNAGTWKDSTVEFLMKGAEWGDRLTWGRLWNACKAEVRDKQKLTGDTLLKATAERFRDVIYSTQVVDSTMTRSQAMRGKSVYGSISTAFMSEPTLSYNLVLKAYTDYTAELRTTGDKKKAWNNAKGKVARALATYLVSAAAAGLVESLVDACRDDDEYATWLEKYLNALIGANYEDGKFSGIRPFDNNLFSDVDILSKLPILKDFMSMISGYGNDRMDTEWISNLIDAYRIWDETVKLETGKLDEPTSVTYNGNMTLYGKIYKTLKAISQATGLPVSAASREVVTLWNTIAGVVGKGDEWTIHTYDSGPENQIKYGLSDGYLTREEAQKLLLDKGLVDDEDEAYWKVDKWATGEGKYDVALAAVLGGDRAAFDAQAKELNEHGIGEKQLQSKVCSQAKKWYVGDDDGKRAVTKEQALKILQQYGGKDADEAQKLVQKWTCEVVTGTDYDDIKDLYLDGKLTRSRAVDMLVRYGGMKQEDAQNKIATADFVKAHPECDGISVEAVQKYNEQAKPAGLDAGTFWEAYQFKNDARTTYDSNGKAISGQGAMDKVAAYIDGLSISREQKNALFLCFYSQKSLGKIRWSN